LDWQIGFVPAWNDYPSVLRGLDTILKTGDNKVLVHCMDGQDRTAFLLFIYLVCCKGCADDEALKLIEKKKDRRGATLMSVVGSDLYSHFCRVRKESGGILPDPLHEMRWQKGGS
jgi:protein-tyrosine phosphatase